MDGNALIFVIGTLAASVILLMVDPSFPGGLAVSAAAFCALWLVSLVV